MIGNAVVSNFNIFYPSTTNTKKGCWKQVTWLKEEEGTKEEEPIAEGEEGIGGGDADDNVGGGEHTVEGVGGVVVGDGECVEVFG